jgi:hypothetical protein
MRGGFIELRSIQGSEIERLSHPNQPLHERSANDITHVEM